MPDASAPEPFMYIPRRLPACSGVSSLSKLGPSIPSLSHLCFVLALSRIPPFHASCLGKCNLREYYRQTKAGLSDRSHRASALVQTTCTGKLEIAIGLRSAVGQCGYNSQESKSTKGAEVMGKARRVLSSAGVVITVSKSLGSSICSWASACVPLVCRRSPPRLAAWLGLPPRTAAAGVPHLRRSQLRLQLSCWQVPQRPRKLRIQRLCFLCRHLPLPLQKVLPYLGRGGTLAASRCCSCPTARKLPRPGASVPRN